MTAKKKSYAGTYKYHPYCQLCHKTVHGTGTSESAVLAAHRKRTHGR